MLTSIKKSTGYSFNTTKTSKFSVEYTVAVTFTINKQGTQFDGRPPITHTIRIFSRQFLCDFVWLIRYLYIPFKPFHFDSYAFFKNIGVFF
jgi:hypothetical protein